MPGSWGIKKIIKNIFSSKKGMNTCSHDCSEIASKVMLVIDGELPPNEEKRLIAEIQECKGCLQHYSIEKSFKEFIAKKVERKSIDPALISSIKQHIQALQV